MATIMGVVAVSYGVDGVFAVTVGKVCISDSTTNVMAMLDEDCMAASVSSTDFRIFMGSPIRHANVAFEHDEVPTAVIVYAKMASPKIRYCRCIITIVSAVFITTSYRISAVSPSSEHVSNSLVAISDVNRYSDDVASFRSTMVCVISNKGSTVICHNATPFGGVSAIYLVTVVATVCANYVGVLSPKGSPNPYGTSIKGN